MTKTIPTQLGSFVCPFCLCEFSFSFRVYLTTVTTKVCERTYVSKNLISFFSFQKPQMGMWNATIARRMWSNQQKAIPIRNNLYLSFLTVICAFYIVFFVDV